MSKLIKMRLDDGEVNKHPMPSDEDLETWINSGQPISNLVDFLQIEGRNKPDSINMQILSDYIVYELVGDEDIEKAKSALKACIEAYYEYNG